MDRRLIWRHGESAAVLGYLIMLHGLGILLFGSFGLSLFYLSEFMADAAQTLYSVVLLLFSPMTYYLSVGGFFIFCMVLGLATLHAGRLLSRSHWELHCRKCGGVISIPPSA